jgi:hypothetical protein
MSQLFEALDLNQNFRLASLYEVAVQEVQTTDQQWLLRSGGRLVFID